MSSTLFTMTNLIVFFTCIVSVRLMDQHTTKANLIFHPMTIHRHAQWYRFLTSGFIHADMLHLIINMFVLWSFGSVVEQLYYPHFLGDLSTTKFLLLYFGGIIFSSIPSYLRHKNDPSYAALGASGGVAAVVFAAIIFAPWQNLYLYGVVAIPQILAGAAYLIYSWHKDKKSDDNIGHMAHFMGAIWGFSFTALLNFDVLVRFVWLTLEGPSWI